MFICIVEQLSIVIHFITFFMRTGTLFLVIINIFINKCYSKIYVHTSLFAQSRYYDNLHNLTFVNLEKVLLFLKQLFHKKNCVVFRTFVIPGMYFMV